MANKRQLTLLKRDIGAWNEWRKKNPKTPIDLAEAQLRDTDLGGANLEYADLQYADLQRTILAGANLKYASLANTHLRGAHLGGAHMAAANMREIDLQGSDMREIDLRGARMAVADLRDVDLQDVDLRDADLQGARMAAADLRGAKLANTNIRNANLERAVVTAEQIVATKHWRAARLDPVLRERCEELAKSPDPKVAVARARIAVQFDASLRLLGGVTHLARQINIEDDTLGALFATYTKISQGIFRLLDDSGNGPTIYQAALAELQAETARQAATNAENQATIAGQGERIEILETACRELRAEAKADAQKIGELVEKIRTLEVTAAAIQSAHPLPRSLGVLGQIGTAAAAGYIGNQLPDAGPILANAADHAGFYADRAVDFGLNALQKLIGDISQFHAAPPAKVDPLDSA